MAISLTKRIIFSLFITILIFGCSTPEVANSVNNQVRSDYNETNHNLEKAKKPGETVGVDTVSATEDLFLGDESIKLDYRQPLPKEFETQLGITLTTKDDISVYQLVNKLYYLSGIPVEVSNINENVQKRKLNISYSGPLSGLLNLVSNELGTAWEYDGKKIILYNMKTKTFTLHTLATDTEYSSKLNADSAGNTIITTTSSLKTWQDIQDTINSIIKNDSGSAISIAKSTGTVTVTASPPTLKEVEKYIRNQNERYSQQVAINVKVMQVSLNDTNSFGLDLGLLFTGNSGAQLGTKAPTLTTPTGSGSLNFAILDTAKGALSNFKDTEATIKALATQGKVSLVTSATLTTRNNRIAPLNNITTFKYISSVSTDTTDSTSITDISPSEETTGFSMQLLPNILDNGRLVLMFNMSLRELVNMDKEPVGSTYIQLPEIENRNFMQELVMKSGQTVVLTGFEKIVNRNNNYGVGKPEFTLLGGGRETESTKDVLVIILTPQILKSALNSEKRAENAYGLSDY